MNKWRKFNIALLLTFAGLYLFTNWYWSAICAVQGCEADFRRGLLATWKQISLFVPFFAAGFLILPVHYFRAYIIKVVSWLLPISTIVIASSDPIPRGFFSLTREEMVNLWAAIWLVITLLFIAYHYYRTKKVGS